MNSRQPEARRDAEVIGLIGLAHGTSHFYHLILAAVFLPVGFIPGIVGRLYQQFAITIAVSVLISAFVALSLTPALCSTMLRPKSRAVTAAASPPAVRAEPNTVTLRTARYGANTL